MDDGGSPWIIIIMGVTIVVLLAVIAYLLLDRRKKSSSKMLPVKELFGGNDEVTEEEIISMVNEGHEQGIIRESEVEMIHNIFDLDDKEAKDIMTHRKNIVCIDGDMSYHDVVAFMVDTGKSRFPVYSVDIDHIIGVLHIKDVLAFAQRNEVFRTSIKDIPGLIREVDFVPETLGINTLFNEMQKDKSHMVMVVDEYGQISGLVAMEDILEEIVGNIEDEHDVEFEHITTEEDGNYLMDGMTSFDEVLETLGITVDEEEDEYETLNGMIISKLEHIPAEDEVASVDAYGYSFCVLKVKDNIIQQVRVSPLAPDKN